MQEVVVPGEDLPRCALVISVTETFTEDTQAVENGSFHVHGEDVRSSLIK